MSNHFKKYIISAKDKQEAFLMAKERGLKPQHFYYVQHDYECNTIREKLRGIRILKKEQLIGYFSDLEVEYLIKK